MNSYVQGTEPPAQPPSVQTVSRALRRSRSLAFAASMIIGLLLAACGTSGAPTTGVATLDPGTGASSNPSAAPSATGADQGEAMLAYSQCMRDNGVPNFPDPVNGGLQIDGNEVGMDTPAYQAADEACKSLMPAPPAGSEEDPQDRERMLAYAQCMRDNGVPEFPDPKPGEGLNLDGAVIDLDSPAFKAAEEACQSLPGAPGGGDSQSNSNTNTQP